MDSNIYLVGFMGTGKTTIGSLLSQRLQKTFVETDSLIEQREKMTIARIFSEKGEAYFREVERNIIKDVSRQRDLVVSCGGGVFVDARNRDIMKMSGKVICLEADEGVVYERTKHCSLRPLLNVENPREAIRDLFVRRRPFYRLAHFTVDTSILTPEEVVEKIQGFLNDG